MQICFFVTLAVSDEAIDQTPFLVNLHARTPVGLLYSAKISQALWLVIFSG
jgi:hypothetical protein